MDSIADSVSSWRVEIRLALAVLNDELSVPIQVLDLLLTRRREECLKYLEKTKSEGKNTEKSDEKVGKKEKPLEKPDEKAEEKPKEKRKRKEVKSEENPEKKSKPEDENSQLETKSKEDENEKQKDEVAKPNKVKLRRSLRLKGRRLNAKDILNGLCKRFF